ncbi:MAG: hypothetical protein DWI64_00085 [Chloroflexi bacterium]|nr:MAG: hypothetical protein DWI64_00085 [Chloroflexota bacterium]
MRAIMLDRDGDQLAQARGPENSVARRPLPISGGQHLQAGISGLPRRHVGMHCFFGIGGIVGALQHPLGHVFAHNKRIELFQHLRLLRQHHFNFRVAQVAQNFQRRPLMRVAAFRPLRNGQHAEGSLQRGGSCPQAGQQRRRVKFCRRDCIQPARCADPH